MLTILAHPPTLDNIRESHRAIRPFIHRTPILTNGTIDRMTGARIFFKCENFQKIGAFKMRGAASAALRLSEVKRARGLATHSSGNHAQAVAKAAQNLGVPAYIVMPENAPRAKMQAAKGYDAQITLCAPTQEARESTLEQIVEKTGAAFIHPYDDYNVIAGQATAGLELLEDVDGRLDCILAPAGGGGLLSGTALISNYLSPKTEVIGGEPKAVDDAWQSLKAGYLVRNTSTDTIADGLKTNVCEKTFSIFQEHVTDIIRVEEEEIVAAMRLVWERMKIIIEPSCAVPLAAVFKQAERFKGRRLGIILTGGNVDLDNLPF